MTGFTNDVKDIMLLASFSHRTFEVALFSGDDEISDRMYGRQAVTFSEPMGEETRWVENDDTVRFPPLTRTVEVDSWGVFENGELRARYKLTKARNIAADDAGVFRPGALRIGII